MRSLTLSLLALVACAETPAVTASATVTEPASAPPPAVSATATATAAASVSAAEDALVGKEAPDFTAAAQDGTSVHLSSLKGRAVVVYFYPKDETPGCTKEACAFRDSWEALGKTGA